MLKKLIKFIFDEGKEKQRKAKKSKEKQKRS